MTCPSSWGPCGTCRYANTEYAPLRMAFCAAPPNQDYPFGGRRMPITEGCTKHEPKGEDDDDQA